MLALRQHRHVPLCPHLRAVSHPGGGVVLGHQDIGTHTHAHTARAGRRPGHTHLVMVVAGSHADRLACRRAAVGLVDLRAIGNFSGGVGGDHVDTAGQRHGSAARGRAGGRDAFHVQLVGGRHRQAGEAGRGVAAALALAAQGLAVAAVGVVQRRCVDLAFFTTVGHVAGGVATVGHRHPGGFAQRGDIRTGAHPGQRGLVDDGHRHRSPHARTAPKGTVASDLVQFGGAVGRHHHVAVAAHHRGVANFTHRAGRQGVDRGRTGDTRRAPRSQRSRHRTKVLGAAGFQRHRVLGVDHRTRGDQRLCLLVDDGHVSAGAHARLAAKSDGTGHAQQLRAVGGAHGGVLGGGTVVGRVDAARAAHHGFGVLVHQGHRGRARHTHTATTGAAGGNRLDVLKRRGGDRHTGAALGLQHAGTVLAAGGHAHRSAVAAGGGAAIQTRAHGAVGDQQGSRCADAHLAAHGHIARQAEHVHVVAGGHLHIAVGGGG